MHLPILRETTRLADLATIPIAVAAIVALDKDRVHDLADQRHRQSRYHSGHGPEHHAGRHLHHTPVLPLLVNRRILQALGEYLPCLLRTTGPARTRLLLLLRVGLEDRRLVRRVLVGGQQIHEPAAGAPLEILNQLLHLVLGALARDHAQHQAVLGVESDMVPVVPLADVLRPVGLTMLLFLADEGPLLIKLGFPRLRGKKPRVHRAVVGHGGQRRQPGAAPYSCSPRPVGWSGAPHNSLASVARPRAPCPVRACSGTTACPYAPRSASDTCDRPGPDVPCWAHCGSTPASCPGRAGRSQGRRGSDSRSFSGRP